MGNAISSAAGSVGGALGNVIAAPFKSIFKGSCKDICSSTWDIFCFIEHLCVNDLARLLMVLCLCYITLLLFYVLFKIGIFQCIGKSLCKMCWAACEAYWCSLYHITRFLCYKIKYTKRVNHRRRHALHHSPDLEKGYKSSSTSETDYGNIFRHETVSRKRKSFQREHDVRLKIPKSHRHIRVKSTKVSFHAKDRSRSLMRRRNKALQVRHLMSGRAKGKSFKKRRL